MAKVVIHRGKPVNVDIEIDTENVESSYPRGRGGVVELKSGAVLALSGDEWREWLKAVTVESTDRWVEPDVAPKKMRVSFAKVIQDARGKYKKGMIR